MVSQAATQQPAPRGRSPRWPALGGFLLALTTLGGVIYVLGLLLADMTAESRSRWGYLVVSYTVLLAFVALLGSAWRDPASLRRCAGSAGPADLAVIRIVVGGIILMNLFWEDLAGTAGLPRELVREMGIIDVLYSIPAFAGILVHYKGLLLAQVLLGVVTLAAIFGLKSRTYCFLAGAGFLLMHGIIRHYSAYFHTMIVPGYVMLALSATPCGDAWSIDSWLRRRAGKPPAQALRSAHVHSWSRLLIWTIIASTYMQAGLSKLSNGGLAWASPESFRHLILIDSLRSYYFVWKFELGVWVSGLPDWLVAMLAWGSLATETLFFLVLIWPLARRILPAMVAAMHVGIWLVQNVAFIDMVLIQIVFYDLARPMRRLRRESRTPQVEQYSTAPPLAHGHPAWSAQLLAGLVMLVIIGQGVIWIQRVEWYPLTANQMYSKSFVRQPVQYDEVIVVYADGSRDERSPGHVIPTFWEGRCRLVIYEALRGNQERADAFFGHWAKVYNQRVHPNERIIGFEVSNRIWDYTADPDDPQRGRVREFYHYDVGRGESVWGRRESLQGRERPVSEESGRA